MREDHCIDKADPRGNPCSRESGDSGKNVGPKEDSAQCCRIDAETNVEPVSHNTLNHKTAGKGVQAKQGTQFEYHSARTVEAEPSL